MDRATFPLYLDVRTVEEHALRRLERSMNIPLDELARRLDELGSKGLPIVVFCQSGRRSALAADILRTAGFVDVTDGGGIDHIVETRLS